jgi:hypothetical protein
MDPRLEPITRAIKVRLRLATGDPEFDEDEQIISDACMGLAESAAEFFPDRD